MSTTGLDTIFLLLSFKLVDYPRELFRFCLVAGNFVGHLFHLVELLNDHLRHLVFVVLPQLEYLVVLQSLRKEIVHLILLLLSLRLQSFQRLLLVLIIGEYLLLPSEHILRLGYDFVHFV